MIFLITITYFALLWLNETRQLTPDGNRYYAMGGGQAQYKPFYLRWLLPKICKQNELIWNLFTILPTALLPVLMYSLLILKGYSETQSLIGGVLVLGLPGVTLINFIGKYLTDGFGMFMVLLSGIAFQTGNILIGIILTGIGTMANEKVFIYSALLSWQPLALLGGIPLLVRYLASSPARDDSQGVKDRLDNPFKTAIQFHKGRYFTMVLNWGLCILALNDLSLQLILVLLIAYGSIIFATDYTRLYQWGFPVVVIATINQIPEMFLIPLLVLHLFNPLRKYCV